MGQAKNFSPPAHDSPARQARWPVRPACGPKQASPRPVPLTKTHKHVPYFFLLSLLPHYYARPLLPKTITLRLFFLLDSHLCAPQVEMAM